ncbi:hypothetical protein [Nesterenkonia rhizosphaerae]|uniref:Terminase small subunit n=1 Tax=Nesterenkonia rhizosphaerae TaxID=1348272 RepID=A0ABP9G2Q2_9MICC
MSRELSPCGTEAAYRRHLRAKESACDDCKRAAAEARKARLDKKKPPKAPRLHFSDEAMAQIRPDLFGDDVSPDDVEDLDDRKERLWIYATLKSAMRYAMPREVASIARELRTVLNELTKQNAEGEGDLASEFEQMLQEREAREHGEGVSTATN